MRKNHRLFGAATVLHQKGDWTEGERHEDLSCGRVTSTVGICDPGELPVVPDSGDAWKVETFAVYVAQRFGYMCNREHYQPIVNAAVDAVSDYQVSDVFWNGPDAAVGTWDGELYLTSPEIETVPRQPDLVDTLALLINTAHARHPELLVPILHLGTTTHLRLQEQLPRLGINFVTSPAYPTDALALTGPITVRLGPIETTEQSIHSVNRFVVEGTRLATVQFSPCRALRATEAP